MLGVLLSLTSAADAQDELDLAKSDRRCLSCHEQTHIATLTPDERLSMVGTWLEPGEQPEPQQEPILRGDEPQTRPDLFVTREHLAQGVHPTVACVECHVDSQRLPHPPQLNRSTCATECHPEAATAFASGAHAEAQSQLIEDAPDCVSCHGGHDMVSPSIRSSPQHHLNNLFLCGQCHEQHKNHTPAGFDPGEHVSAYLFSSHGLGVTEAGLMFAATCVDCHGPHGAYPSGDERSPVHRERIPETCGSCHLGVVETYDKSIHGIRLREGDEKAPVCTDCHTAHGISHVETHSPRLNIVRECGECHDDPEMSGKRKGRYYDTYLASYHGQVTQLGGTRAASCSDCHGSHDMLPLSEPDSRVHAANLVQTCSQTGCHPGANTNFVRFDPHADYRDREEYPILNAIWIYFVIVMSSAFGFFGLRSLLWFGRSMIERIKHGPPERHEHDTNAIRRFTVLNRINHVFVAITFFGLTATGIPLVFSHEAWAGNMANVMGGIMLAGVWHRVFAVMLIGNFVVHFVGLGIAASHRRGALIRWALGPDSMVPKWRDVTDCIAMFRWFMIGGTKPPFDRWTYFEKFDYWAEIFGSFIIGGSGLLLWFPTVASSVFPGEVFNIAMIVHGYEALLAIGFIFTIHFFNANLRPDKFPVDEVIFSGQLSESELKEERPDEYERLVQSGQLDELRVPPWPRTQRPLWVVTGLLAMGVGIALLALIVFAGLRLL